MNGKNALVISKGEQGRGGGIRAKNAEGDAHGDGHILVNLLAFIKKLRDFTAELHPES